MSFITIIIAWGLVQHWGSGTPIQRDDWFDLWYSKVREGVRQPVGIVAVTLLVPALALMIVASWFEHILFGLLHLGLGVVVLLYGFGRGDFAELVAGFVQRWRRADFEGAYLYASGTLALEDPKQDSDDPDSILQEVNREILYNGYERWFAVVFYFLLGGLAGALVYRLVHLLADRAESAEERDVNATLLAILDWLPVRVLALAFAVTGNFVQTLEPLVESVRDWQQSARGLLVEAAEAALGPANPDTASDPVKCRTRELQKLLQRSAAAWIAALALFTIFS